METLEKGKERIEAISRKLRCDVLEPARAEAQLLIEQGEERKRELIEEGERLCLEMTAAARAVIAQERQIFESSLEQTLSQSQEHLRQKIEQELLMPQLGHLVEQRLSDPLLVANFLDALVEAVRKEGLEVDMEALIGREIHPEELAKLLSERVLQALKEKPVRVDQKLKGGVELYLEGDNSMHIALSEEYLIALLFEHARGSLRELFFRTQGG